jgi:hypothetical protein
MIIVAGSGPAVVAVGSKGMPDVIKYRLRQVHHLPAPKIQGL